MKSLLENKTWELIQPPTTVKTLSAKWVFKLKRGKDGEITRFKAQWVVKDYSQTRGIDYNKTFASVVKPQSYKTIFALAAARDWDLEQMDVSTAFLYEEVEEDIYFIQPVGLEDGSDRVCKLQKALYGLKQAPCVWSTKVEKLLKKYGYIPFDSDSSVYHKLDQEIIIAIYVDDILIASSSWSEILRAKCMLKSNFRMVELGPLHLLSRDDSNSESASKTTSAQSTCLS